MSKVDLYVVKFNFKEREDFKDLINRISYQEKGRLLIDLRKIVYDNQFKIGRGFLNYYDINKNNDDKLCKTFNIALEHNITNPYVLYLPLFVNKNRTLEDVIEKHLSEINFELSLYKFNELYIYDDIDLDEDFRFEFPITLSFISKYLRNKFTKNEKLLKFKLKSNDENEIIDFYQEYFNDLKVIYDLKDEKLNFDNSYEFAKELVYNHYKNSDMMNPLSILDADMQLSNLFNYGNENPIIDITYINYDEQRIEFVSNRRYEAYYLSKVLSLKLDKSKINSIDLYCSFDKENNDLIHLEYDTNFKNIRDIMKYKIITNKEEMYKFINRE